MCDQWMPQPGFYKFNSRVVHEVNDTHIKNYIRERFGKLLIFDRTRCLEMFSEVKIGKERMYEPKSTKSLISYKLKR